jgi:putative membrane protein
LARLLTDDLLNKPIKKNKIMKINRASLSIILCASFTSMFFNASAQKDSKKVADKQNEQKFEDTKLEKDADFVVNAADGGLFEVQASALAKTNASSEKVKMLAEHIVTDHSKANEELKKVAAKKNITLPGKLSNKMQEKFDELTKLKGEDFDKEYTKTMIDAHKDAIDMFEKEAEKGKDGELKAWAAGKVATLKSHLQMAESAHDMVK